MSVARSTGSASTARRPVGRLPRAVHARTKLDSAVSTSGADREGEARDAPSGRLESLLTLKSVPAIDDASRARALSEACPGVRSITRIETHRRRADAVIVLARGERDACVDHPGTRRIVMRMVDVQARAHDEI